MNIERKVAASSSSGIDSLAMELQARNILSLLSKKKEVDKLTDTQIKQLLACAQILKESGYKHIQSLADLIRFRLGVNI